ncbi:hypothetical protein CJ030_MR7G015259 [Morella rubra]|uniref:DUF21 domain-containing protein n=1 Tax=Morella rubra TaxID=262757 RepID=A0A6A1UZ26_9ROSI|nr:hypothetical protein CJ030_MR7G015259 [Morella rubra]
MAANDVPCCEPMFWVYLIICVVLVAFAGLMSGLTLGLISLSLVDLEVIAKAGQPQDRKNAAEKILPLVKNHHLLLCTLLIAMPRQWSWAAVLISITMILAFGEIIPQAVCSRYGLSVGAKLSFLVRLLVLVLFPVAYPISKLLDWLLGKGDAALLRRDELKILVDMHGRTAGKGGELTQDETTIIAGALEMTQKTAKDAMTPISEIFSLSIDSRLDEQTMGLILSKGHSRVPIYSGSQRNIIGLILVKNLIKFRPEDETPIKDLVVRRIPRIHDCLPLYDLLNEFQKGHSHMAVVIKSKKGTTDNPEKEAKPGTIKSTIDLNSRQRHGGIKGIDHQQQGQNHKRLKISIASPASIFSSDSETQYPSLDNASLRNSVQSLQSKKWDRREGNILGGGLESLPHDFDAEVVGIITLEDVIEELLQEEILDETDDYVHVDEHRKPSPLRSPAAPSGSRLQRQTSAASPVSSYGHTPLSSCNHSPILRSPISAYLQSPLMRPTLSPSPKRSMPNYPPVFAGGARYSPSLQKVSRMLYEKLRQPDGP